MKKELIQFILALILAVIVGIVLFVALLMIVLHSIGDVYASNKSQYIVDSTVSWTPETEN